MEKETDTLDYARSIVEQQAKALHLLVERIPNTLEPSVQRILEATENGNRVVVTGIGKAGYIGMRISASLASISVPSFFLHPSEAVHGDLGRVHPGDIILMLSNSGETEELTRLLPPLERRQVFIISITSNKNSTIGRQANLTIDFGSIEEAGHLKIAPTSSSLVLSSLGDALITTVAWRRDLSKEEFAINHPGGSLGRSLMSVEKIMRVGESHCILNENLSVLEVIQAYTATPGRPGAASLVNSIGVLSGVFTDGNLRRLLASNELSFLYRPIKEVMTRNPKVIKHTALAKEAFDLLTQYEIDQVIVVDSEDKPVGLVDIQDASRMFRGLE
jgi:arabinose-5-phosphate isomerase